MNGGGGAGTDRARGWATAPERGSAFWSGLGLRLVLRFGWAPGRALLPPITAWFLATSPAARAASRDYLARALGRRATLLDVARHVHAFAGAILDAPFFLSGRTARFRVEVSGLEELARHVEVGRGCVLLGAHLGSFEALRHVSRACPVPVRPLMYRRNAGAMTALLDRLDPALAAGVIPLGEPDALLRAREAVARGEVVGILGDRDPGAGRRVVVPFLGGDAPFPAGPMVLAALLEAPVVLARAVRTGPRRYDVRFEPFAERVVLRRAERDRDLREAVGRYASWLEAACRAHPYQWFNFFAFWAPPAGGGGGGPGARADAPEAAPRAVP